MQFRQQQFQQPVQLILFGDQQVQGGFGVERPAQPARRALQGQTQAIALGIGAQQFGKPVQSGSQGLGEPARVGKKFGLRLSCEAAQWRMMVARPVPGEPVIQAKINQDRRIAAQGALPAATQGRNGRMKIGQVVDTPVQPDARGQLRWKAIQVRSLDEIAEDGAGQRGLGALRQPQVGEEVQLATCQASE